MGEVVCGGGDLGLPGVHPDECRAGVQAHGTLNMMGVMYEVPWQQGKFQKHRCLVSNLINHVGAGMLIQMTCMMVWVAMPNKESYLMSGVALAMPNT